MKEAIMIELQNKMVRANKDINKLKQMISEKESAIELMEQKTAIRDDENQRKIDELMEERKTFSIGILSKMDAKNKELHELEKEYDAQSARYANEIQRKSVQLHTLHDSDEQFIEKLEKENIGKMEIIKSLQQQLEKAKAQITNQQEKANEAVSQLMADKNDLKEQLFKMDSEIEHL